MPGEVAKQMQPHRNPCQNDGYLGEECTCICRPGTHGRTCQNVSGGYYDHLKSPCSVEVNYPTIISSPNYPRNYDAGAWCVYRVEAPECQAPQVTIQDFQLGPRDHRDYCFRDYLEVRNASLYDGFLVCGTEVVHGTTWTSTSNTIILYFTGDEGGHRGFQARVTFVPIPGCCRSYSNSTWAYFFHTPGYPNPYTHSFNCSYTLPQEAPAKVEVRVVRQGGEGSAPPWTCTLTLCQPHARCRRYCSILPSRTRRGGRRKDTTDKVGGGSKWRKNGRGRRSYENSNRRNNNKVRRDEDEREEEERGKEEETVWKIVLPNVASTHLLQYLGDSSPFRSEGAAYQVAFTLQESPCHQILFVNRSDPVGWVRVGREAVGMLQCEWWIQAPRGSHVKVTVEHLTLPSGEDYYLALNEAGEAGFPRATTRVYQGVVEEEAVVEVPPLVSLKHEMCVVLQGPARTTFLAFRYQLYDCEDTNSECSYWAAMGECDNNPAWMSRNCRTSCIKCDYSAVCEDEHRDCNFWAQHDQCEENDVWMSVHCRHSCGHCDKCRDTNWECESWAGQEECERNPLYMAQFCRKSCHLCLEEEDKKMNVTTGDDDLPTNTTTSTSTTKTRVSTPQTIPEHFITTQDPLTTTSRNHNTPLQIPWNTTSSRRRPSTPTGRNDEENETTRGINISHTFKPRKYKRKFKAKTPRPWLHQRKGSHHQNHLESYDEPITHPMNPAEIKQQPPSMQVNESIDIKVNDTGTTLDNNEGEATITLTPNMNLIQQHPIQPTALTITTSEQETSPSKQETSTSDLTMATSDPKTSTLDQETSTSVVGFVPRKTRMRGIVTLSPNNLGNSVTPTVPEAGEFGEHPPPTLTTFTDYELRPGESPRSNNEHLNFPKGLIRNQHREEDTTTDLDVVDDDTYTVEKEERRQTHGDNNIGGNEHQRQHGQWHHGQPHKEEKVGKVRHQHRRRNQRRKKGNNSRRQRNHNRMRGHSGRSAHVRGNRGRIRTSGIRQEDVNQEILSDQKGDSRRTWIKDDDTSPPNATDQEGRREKQQRKGGGEGRNGEARSRQREDHWQQAGSREREGSRDRARTRDRARSRDRTGSRDQTRRDRTRSRDRDRTRSRDRDRAGSRDRDRTRSRDRDRTRSRDRDRAGSRDRDQTESRDGPRRGRRGDHSRTTNSIVQRHPHRERNHEESFSNTTMTTTTTTVTSRPHQNIPRPSTLPHSTPTPVAINQVMKRGEERMVAETPGRYFQRKTKEREGEHHEQEYDQNVEEEMKYVVRTSSLPPHQNKPTSLSSNNSVHLPFATTSHKQRKKRKKKKKKMARHSESKRRRGKRKKHRRRKHKERRGKHRRGRLYDSQRQQGSRSETQTQQSPSSSARGHLQKGPRMQGNNNNDTGTTFISKPQHLEDPPGTPRHLQKGQLRFNNNTTQMRISYRNATLGIIRPQETAGEPRVYIMESSPLHHHAHNSSVYRQHVPTSEVGQQNMESMATRYLKTRDDDDERQHPGPLASFQIMSEKLASSQKWKENDGGGERREWQGPSSLSPPVAENYAEWGIGPLRPSHRSFHWVRPWWRFRRGFYRRGKAVVEDMRGDPGRHPS
ncbi:hypothetical protein Pcinc_021824 [Petrolisthes cinctipes]|uniref:Uncharacterized protein n=1 Tax=Petrolisthes cinctipes TaxID=88211 RepID=A0AAE1KGW6_PETCI|nr:hypothetical protein Pcinc_021824 [Petrolisthes cinctipes]